MTIRNGPPGRAPPATKKYDGNHAARDFSRGLQTKNLVKGAAGGARGVDYHDRDAEYLERRDSSAAQNAKAAHKTAKAVQAERKEQAREVQKQQESAAAAGQTGAPDTPDDQFDPRKVVNQNALQKDTPEQRKQRLEAERLKKKILDPDAVDDDDEQEDEEEPEEEAAAAEESASDSGPSLFADSRIDRVVKRASAEVIARLLDDPEVEMRLYGTLSVRDAAGIKEAFKTPLRVARHLNVLARRISDSDEGRPAAVRALADTILELGPVFGRRVLSSFQTGVGIGEVYPLEVVEEIAMRNPRFLPHLQLSSFLTTPERLQAVEGEAVVLRCDPALKVTGFALKGGGQPGYAFTPDEEPGSFSLLIDSAGRYRLLLLSLDADKNERLQELRVHVKPPTAAPAQGG